MIWSEISRLKSPRRRANAARLNNDVSCTPPRARVVALDVGVVAALVVDLGLLGVGHHVAGVAQREVDVGLGDLGQPAARTSAARS